MRVAKPVQLNAEDDRRLRILSKRKRVEARVQMRARIVLLAAEGMSDKDIAGKLDTAAELQRAGEHAFWPLAWTVCCKTPRARDARAPRAKPPTWNRWCASRSSTRPKGRLTGALAPWPRTLAPAPLPWPASGAPMA